MIVIRFFLYGGSRKQNGVLQFGRDPSPRRCQRVFLVFLPFLSTPKWRNARFRTEKKKKKKNRFELDIPFLSFGGCCCCWRRRAHWGHSPGAGKWVASDVTKIKSDAKKKSTTKKKNQAALFPFASRKTRFKKRKIINSAPSPVRRGFGFRVPYANVFFFGNPLVFFCKAKWEKRTVLFLRKLCRFE